jgi:hypothetical protein
MVVNSERKVLPISRAAREETLGMTTGSNYRFSQLNGIGLKDKG